MQIFNIFFELDRDDYNLLLRYRVRTNESFVVTMGHNENAY